MCVCVCARRNTSNKEHVTKFVFLTLLYTLSCVQLYTNVLCRKLDYLAVYSYFYKSFGHTLPPKLLIITQHILLASKRYSNIWYVEIQSHGCFP